MTPHQRYIFFLSITLLATLAIYGGARLGSMSAVLFVVVNIGNAHYLMAYLASIRRWRLLSRPVLLRRLMLWLGASALYFLIFYASGIPFGWTVLSILILAVVHNFRDYAFFYHRLSSPSGSNPRPLALTYFLSAAFLTILFLALSWFPEKKSLFFFEPIPDPLFIFGAALSGAVAVACGYRLLRQFFLHRQTLLPSAFIIIPSLSGAFAGSLGAINLIDYVFPLTLWHYLLWLAYTFLTLRRTEKERMSAKPDEGRFAKVFALNSSGMPQLLISTVLIHTAVFLAAMGALWLGHWKSFPEFAYNSFLWGFYGYPFWSFLHIAFSVFPPYEQPGFAPRQALRV